MTYNILIAEYNSAGIRAIALECGATRMRHLGTGHSDGNLDNPNSAVSFYELLGSDGFPYRVADTNGDPVWEDEDSQAFAELAHGCGVAI